MSGKKFRVGRSHVGLGLFATEFIDKGSFIVEYKGRMLPDAVACELSDRGAKYLYEINSRWTVDGSSRRNVARYANHSCRPNAESDVTRDKKIIIRAIKRIFPGDEITYDYGKDHFNGFIKPIGCQCDKCREKRREERAAARAKAARAAARAKRNGKAAGTRSGAAARKAKRR